MFVKLLFVKHSSIRSKSESRLLNYFYKILTATVQQRWVHGRWKDCCRGGH